jgi:hypothetical protein
MRMTAAIAALVLVGAVYGAKPTAKPKRAPVSPEQRAAQALLKSMSLRDRVAQLVIGVAYGDVPSRTSPEYEKFRHWVHDLRIGGLIINNRVQYGIARNADRGRGFRTRRIDAGYGWCAISVQHGDRRGGRCGSGAL